mmetsp:Transcript_17753/g.38848  ORF Transcript_17753/g.38848 Transcript_17753/m.38848 type:complete len:215 (-) Transcript_17753:1653-2297(-)
MSDACLILGMSLVVRDANIVRVQLLTPRVFVLAVLLGRSPAAARLALFAGGGGGSGGSVRLHRMTGKGSWSKARRVPVGRVRRIGASMRGKLVRVRWMRLLCVGGEGWTLVFPRCRARWTIVLVVVVVLMGRCGSRCFCGDSTWTAGSLLPAALGTTSLATLSPDERSSIRNATVEGPVMSRTGEERLCSLPGRRQRMRLVVPERSEILFLVSI